LNFIYESIIAHHYGWNLEQIRALDYYDFLVHLRICLVRENVDFERKMLLSGHSPSKRSAEDILKTPVKKGQSAKYEAKQEFDPASGSFKDKRTASPDRIYQRVNLKEGKLLGDK